MKPLWVIQENLNDDDIVLLPVMKRLGIKYELIKIIPFSDNIPDVDYDGPIIVRGSTTTLRNTEKKNWSPGVWHNDNFKPSVYRDNYRNHFLNKDGQVALLKDSDKLWKQQHMFVRPNSDYKDLTGEVKTAREIRKLIKGAEQGFYPFSSDLELFIAPPIKIPNEYRFTVVGKEVVSGYQYRRSFQLKKLKTFPWCDEWMFADRMVKIWNPDDVYCLDIGVTKDKRIGVIECNCFNASGIYGDAETVFKKVDEFVNGLRGWI